MTDRMRIGELTRRADVTARTVRYYEGLGLIPPGERQGVGQRYYSADTVARLRKIDQLKALGLSLDEIGSVIDFYFTDPSGVAAKRKVLGLLRRHLADADGKIDALGQFRAELRTHIERFEAWFRVSGEDQDA